MTAEEDLINWFLKNKENLSLEVLSCTWPQDLGLEVYDFQTKIKIQNSIFIGRGTDSNQQTALVKSFVETLERKVCEKHGIRSNGVAAHFEEEKAAYNAKKELIERDLFFCYFLTKKTPPNSPPVSIDKTITAYLRRHRVDMSFKNLGVFNNSVHSIMCIANGLRANHSFGYLIGLGTSSSFKKACTIALWECLRNITATLEENDKSTRKYKVSDFDDNHILTQKHIDYALDTKNKNLFDFLFQDSCSPSIEESLPYKVQTQTLGIDFDLPVPFYTVRATSSQAQQAFWGKVSPSLVNLKRLELFSSTKLDYKKINTNIHPLG